MITVEHKGLEGAEEMIATLRAYGATPMGAAFLAKKRAENPDVTNRDILDWLAEPQKNSRVREPKPRDIRITDRDAASLLDAFSNRLMERVRQAAKSNPAFQSTPVKVNRSKTEAKATAVLASALREACKRAAVILANRIESSIDNDGVGLEQVGPKYARQRSRRYGVGTNAILKATGQLLNNLLQGVVEVYKR